LNTSCIAPGGRRFKSTHYATWCSSALFRCPPSAQKFCTPTV